MCVCGEVVGLAGVGVGVEEEVYAAVLLFLALASIHSSRSMPSVYLYFARVGGKLTAAAIDIHLDTNSPFSASLVVIIPNLFA